MSAKSIGPTAASSTAAPSNPAPSVRLQDGRGRRTEVLLHDDASASGCRAPPPVEGTLRPDEGALRATLGPADVHLWTADLRSRPEPDLLEPSELTRARRFARDVDRDRFVATRSALRALVARYIGESPRELRFVLGRWGKPELPGTRLRFNVSHSGDLAAFAFALDDDIGVDLEYVGEALDRTADVDDLATRVCTPQEQNALASLDGRRRVDGFYRLWTRKEAFLKACGRGLSRDPREIAVSITGDGLLSAPGHDASAWTLEGFPVPTGYVAAYAVGRPGAAVRLFDFDQGVK